MHRTQILLGDEELALLDSARRVSGESRAELIRRAVRKQYASYGKPSRTPEERLANIRAARGIWADRPFTAEEYVRAIRGGDMNANPRRIGAVE